MRRLLVVLVGAFQFRILRSKLEFGLIERIEAIRGVQISKGTLDVLMEAGWVRTAGRRDGPGRPLLYATNQEFLAHFGLSSRRDLPGIDDLKAAGLLDPLDEAEFQLRPEDAELESAEEDD